VAEHASEEGDANALRAMESVPGVPGLPPADKEQEAGMEAAVTGSSSANGMAAAAGAGPQDLQLTSSDLNPNMDEVMKVLTDLGETFSEEDAPGDQVHGHADSGVGNGHHHNDAMVVVPPRVVQRQPDKAEMAETKLAELNARQEDLEKTFSRLSKRLGLMRYRFLGAHIADELTRLRDFAEDELPPPPSTTVGAPKIDPLAAIRGPPKVPEGVVLPSVPSAEVLANAGPTVKEEPAEPSTAGAAPEPESNLTEEGRQKMDEVLGQLESNLNQVVQMHDSDATESSSGGESADEYEGFAEANVDYLPVRKRAKWAWMTGRAGIASRWTWLTAQISDLEYRIRQQTEVYRQIRATKGVVMLGEPVVSWPRHARKAVQDTARPDQDVPLDMKPVTKDYSRTDSAGRKILIKEPATQQLAVAQPAGIQAAESDDDSGGACRTRPVKMIRRRRILNTESLYRKHAKAAKECSVRCDCVHPLFWCSICYGRINHTQMPDPSTQEKGQCMSLLDHSYHQVLSTPEDVSGHLLFMQKIKSRSWADPPPKEDEWISRRRMKKLKKEEEEEAAEATAAKKKKKIVRRKEKGAESKRSRNKGDQGVKKRRSLTVHHHSDDRVGAVINDLSSDGGDTIFGVDGGSPVPSPAVGGGATSQAWADHIRRKRETAFDIDNIVIPYSMAAATRVEKLKYKEILTPTWRPVGEKEEQAGKAILPEQEEDISQTAYEGRHSKAEQEEKRRWQLPVYKSQTGGQRSRNRRQDSFRTEASSGCNTPTDPLSPGVVESLEVNTRPSTPTGADEVNAASASASAPCTVEKSQQLQQQPMAIRNRRRTSSVTKSRERNPSEEASRCASPVQQQPEQAPAGVCENVAHEEPPYEARKFPLDEDFFSKMLAEMPEKGEAPKVAPAAAAAEQEETSGSAGVKRTLSDAFGDSPAAAPASGSLPPAPGSSSGEEDEGEDAEDPDWNEETAEDDDPEWAEKTEKTEKSEKSEKSEKVGAGSAPKGTTSGAGSGRKSHGLTLKMPK